MKARWAKVLFMVTAGTFLLNNCQNPASGLGSRIDVFPPTVSISQPEAGDNLRRVFTAAGSAKDDLKLKTVRVLLTDQSTSQVAFAGNASLQGTSWTLDLDTQAQNIPDSNYYIIAQSEDDTGKTSETRILVTIDNTPPTVMVNSPSFHGDDIPAYNQYITFKGEAYDPNQITKVEVDFLDSTTFQSVVSGPLEADGTNTWIRRVTTSALPDGNYLLWVRATDLAQNVSTYFYHLQDIRSLLQTASTIPTIDTLGKLDQIGLVSDDYPELTRDALGLKSVPLEVTGESKKVIYPLDQDTNKPRFSLTLPEDGGSVGANSRVLGTLSDDKDGLDLASVKVSLWQGGSMTGEAWKTFFLSTAAGDFSASAGDAVPFGFDLKDARALGDSGWYTMKMEAQDGFSIPAVPDVRSFFYNSSGPSITNIIPSNNAYIGTAGTSLILSASDDGGIAKAQLFIPHDAALPASEVVFSNPQLTVNHVFQLEDNFLSQWREANKVIENGVEKLPSYVTARVVVEDNNSVATAGKQAALRAQLLLNYEFDELPPTLLVSSPQPAEKVNGIMRIRVSADDAGQIRSNQYQITAGDVTAAGLDSAAWINYPSGQSLYNPQVSVDTRNLTGSSQKLWLKVVDLAGNTYLVDDGSGSKVYPSVAFTVDQASDRPVISLTNLDVAVTTEAEARNNKNALSDNLVIAGKVKDDDAADPDKVFITLRHWEDEEWKLASDKVKAVTDGVGSEITFQYDISLFKEGLYRLQVEAWDTDASGAKSGLPPVSATLPVSGDVYFVVNKGAPEISLPTLSSRLVKDTLTITGTTYDGNSVSGVEYSIDGGQTYSSGGVTFTPGKYTAASPGSWSVALDVTDTEVFSEGAETVLIRGKDEFNRTSAAREVSFTVDRTAPTVPAVDVGTFWKPGPALDFSGTASDTNGITAVSYRLEGTGVDTSLTGWNNASVTLSGTSADWRITLLDMGKVGEGTRKLVIRAQDGAGNQSELQTADFGLDLSSPVLQETSIGLTNQADAVKALNALFALSGTYQDTNSLKSLVITQEKNGTTATVLDKTSFADEDTAAAGVSGAWTTTAVLPDGGLADGEYTYTIVLTDMADKVVSRTRKVIVDRTAPTFTIQNPVASMLVTSDTLAAQGTSTDGSGQGVKKLVYHLGLASETPPADYTAWTSATGLSPWSIALNLGTSGLNKGEGSYILRVRAVDNADNWAAEQSVTFYYDKSAPTISSAAAASQTTNLAVNLTGTAADSNGITAVTAQMSTNYGVPAGYAVTDTSGSGAWTSWSINLPTTLGEGRYDLKVTVTDRAGRTAELSRTVILDLAAPTVAISTPASGVPVSVATITAAGTAGDGTGSGVSKVEYSLNYTNDGNDTNDTWLLLDGTNNWNKTINLGAEGSKTLSVRATDGLNQVSTVVSHTFNLDLTPPALAETGLGSAPYRKSDDFTLSGTASDTNGLLTYDHDSDAGTAAVPYVEVSVNGAAAVKRPVSGGSWTYPYTVAADGSGDGDVTFVVSATDVVNKVSSLTRIVTVDTQEPEISVDGVLSGIAGGKVNGTISYRFGAADSGVGIERSGTNYVAWRAVGASAPALSAAMTGWTQMTSTSTNFNFTYDTSALGLTGDETLNLHIAVRDGVTGAWNVAVNTEALTVNQESDRPVITLDNLDDTVADNNSGNAANSLGQNPSILLTVSEDDKVDVSLLEYRIDINNDGDFLDQVDVWNGTNQIPDGDTSDKWEDETLWYPVDEKPLSDLSLAQGKIKLEKFPQGLFRIQIRAQDINGTSLWPDAAGWAAFEADTKTNFGWNKTVIVRFAVDYGPPTLTVTSPVSGTYRDKFTLSGSSADALGVSEVKWRLVSAADPNPAYSANLISSGTPTSFAISVADIDVNGFTSGEYTLEVIATDVGGYSTTTQIPLTVDTTAPTLSYLSPSDGAVDVNGTITVRGEAQDNRLVGKVFLWHGLASVDTSTLTLPVRTGPGTYSEGSYTTPVTGTGVWTAQVSTAAAGIPVADGGSGPQLYKVSTVVVDAIGNVSTRYDRTFTVDQTKDRPGIAFSNLTVGAADNRLGSGGRVIGTVEDDDAVRLADINAGLAGNQPGLQILLDKDQDGDLSDETWEYVSNVQSSNAVVASWYHDVSSLSQGLMKARVRVLDTQAPAANLTEFAAFTPTASLTPSYNWTEYPAAPDTLNFFIDFGPPVLTDVAPASNTKYNTSSFTITAKASDGLGLQKMSVAVDLDGNGSFTTTGGEWTDADADGIVDSGEWTDTNTDGWVNSGELFIKLGGTDESTPLQNSSAVYNFSLPVTGVADGTINIQLKAYDLSYAETVRDLAVVVDTTAPTAVIATPGEGDTVNGTIKFSGTADDVAAGNGAVGIISTVEYQVAQSGSDNGLADFPGETAGWVVLTGQTNNWSVNLTTTTWTNGSGYILKVRSKDQAGNYSTAVTRNITVDQETDRPWIQVVSLTEGGTAVTNLLPGDRKISGTIQDDDGVKASSIQFQVLNAAGDTILVDWRNVTGQPGSDSTFVVWTTDLSTNLGGIYTSGLPDGTYQLKVRAYDTLGATDYSGFSYSDQFKEYLTGGSSAATADNAGVNFAIDTSNPTVTTAKPAQNFFTDGQEDRNRNGILDAGEDADGDTVLDTGVVYFSGTVSDSSGITSTQISYRLQGAGSFTNIATTGGTTAGSAPVAWSGSLDVSGLAEGVYDWQVVTTDAFGKTNVDSRIFTLDKTAPSVVISAPDGVDPVNGSLLVTGTATDKWKTSADGFQVTSVRIWIGTTAATPPASTSFYTRDDGTNLIHTGTHWKELTGTNSWSYRFNTSALDGNYRIHVVALDNSGNISSALTRDVVFDQTKNLPTFSFTSMTAGSVSGTLDSATTTTFTDNATAPSSLIGNTSVAAGWYVKFLTGGEIRKVSGFVPGTGVVTFDPPLAALPTGDYRLFPNLGDNTLKITGTVDDDDGVVPTVEIRVDRNGDGDYLDTDEGYTTTGLTTGTSGGKKTFSYDLGTLLAQGLNVYKLQIRATDLGEPTYGVAAVSDESTEVYFARDDGNPSNITLDEFGNGFEIKTSGIVGSNYRNTLNLKGKSSDGVRVARVRVKIGAGTYTDFAVTPDTAHYATWSYSATGLADLVSDGETTVTVETTDVFGKITENSFTFNFDKTGPTVTIDAPTAAALINGSLTATGTASDSFKVADVRYWIEDDPAVTAPADRNSWTAVNSGTTSWNFSFDSATRTYGSKTIKVVARDNAGNFGTPVTRTVVFDQGLNTPVIRLTGLNAKTYTGSSTGSTTTSLTDSSLIGNTVIRAGWTLTFADGTTARTLSGFTSGTGEMTWASALGSAFPVGTSYTLAAPVYTIDSVSGSTITDNAAGVSSLIGAPGVAAGWAVEFLTGPAAGKVRLVTAFDSGNGILTLAPDIGSAAAGNTFTVMPLTLLTAGSTLNGTVIDDDAVDPDSLQAQFDLNDDGVWDTAAPVSSKTGSGTSLGFSQNLTSVTQGTLVYRVRFTGADTGGVTRTSESFLFAKDDGAPNDAALLTFGNGYYGSGAVAAKTGDFANSYVKDRISLTGSASDGVLVTLVEVNVNGQGWQNATGTTGWSYSRTGLGALTDGDPVPVLVRTTDYWGKTTETTFSFKADTAAPSLVFASFGRKINGSETVAGTGSDTHSSIHRIYKWTGTGAPTAFDPLNPTANSWTSGADGAISSAVTGTNTWSFTLDTAQVHNAATDQTYNLYVTAVDQAGNFTTVNHGETINQDSDRPVITFSNITMTGTAAANRFDSNPKVIGTVSDDDGVDKAKILVSLDGSSFVAVTNPPANNGTAGGTVTFTHDLSDLSGTVDSSTTTSFTDNALIGKTQVVAGSWQAVLNVSGSAVVRDISAFNSTDGTVTWATAVAAAPTASYTLKLKEGSHTISIIAGDTGSPAWTDRASSYRWEQSDGDAAAGWQLDATDISYDTGAPEITFTSLVMGARTGSTRTLNITSEASMNGTLLNNDWTLNGTVLDGSNVTLTVKVDGGAPVTLIDANTPGSWSHLFDWINGSDVPSETGGSKTITLTAADAFGKSTTKTLSVTFDATRPVLTISSPADGNADFIIDDAVNGTVFMAGTLSEAASVSYGAGNGFDKQTVAAGSPVASWTYSFNSAALRNSTDGTYVSGDDGSGGGTASNGIEDGTEVFVYSTLVRIRAEDPAGNVTVTDYTFTIDNNTDRPTATINLPAEGAYQAGEILASGLTSDDNQADDGVATVWIQVDANGDGDFSDSLTFTGAGTTPGAGNDPFEDESLYYKVPAAQLINRAAWTFYLNKAGTLKSRASPAQIESDADGSLIDVTVADGDLAPTKTGLSGMIKFRVLAVDRHGVVGLASAARTFWIDESFPSIPASNVLPAGSAYTPGVGTLVRGTTTLTALFTDDQALSAGNISIAYNTQPAAAVPAASLETDTWNGKPVHVLKKASATAVKGVSGSTTATSLTAAALDNLSWTAGSGLVVYTSAGTRVITGFTDGTGEGTITWSGDLVLDSAEPFIVVLPLEIDTQGTLGGTDYLDKEGPLTVRLTGKDGTNQTSQREIEFNVDNQRPTGVFNFNDSLTYSGANRTTGLYSFFGNNQTANLLVGSVTDTGTISGVKRVEIYFVKDMDKDGVYDTDGTDKFWTPRASKVSTDVTALTALYATGAGTTTNIPYPSDSAYIISVDKRTENLVYDQDYLTGGNFGDNDGFQESLLSKAGYDEWKVYFDTNMLPDGPMWIFAVYEDDAGNRSYQRINGQITNNPPTIPSVNIGSTSGAGGTAMDSSRNRIKVGGSVEITINAADAEGIEAATYQLTVIRKFDLGALNVVGSEMNISTPLDVTVNPASNTFSTVGNHGLSANNMVRFSAATLPGGMVSSAIYYVRDTNLTATTFEISEERGGPAVDVTTSGTTVSYVVPWYYGTNGLDDFIDRLGGNVSPKAYVDVDLTNAKFEDGKYYQFLAEAEDTDGNAVTRSFYILVSNNDVQAPTATIDDFTVTKHQITGSGHIEEITGLVAPNNDSDADLSGSVKITGTAADDGTVADVFVEYSMDSSNWYFVNSSPAALSSAGLTVDNAADSFTTSVNHGLAADTRVRFVASTIPAGLTAGTEYFVSASGLTPTVFKVSATAGGAVVNITSDGTAVKMVRAVLPATAKATLTDVSDVSDPVGSKSYTWLLSSWDTSTITGVAKTDLVLRAVAIDTKPNTGFSSGKTVDVVPYITDVLTGNDTGLRAFVKRSALGKYSLARGSTDFTIKGYNFASGSTLSINGTGATIVGTPTATQIEVDNLSGYTSGAIVVTTNTVGSRNNSNNNTLTNNKEPNSYNNLLVDDRYIAFWDLIVPTTDGLAAGASNKLTSAGDPVMRPNAGRTGFNWMYTQGGRELWLRQAAPDTQINAGYTFKVTEGNSLKGGDFLYNSSNSFLFVFDHDNKWHITNNDYAYYGSMQWGALPGGGYDFNQGSAGTQTYTMKTSVDEAYNWHFYEGFPKVAVGNSSGQVSGSNPNLLPTAPTYTNFSLNRWSKPRMVSIGSNATIRNYVAYYDTANGSQDIAFYGFKSGTTDVGGVNGSGSYVRRKSSFANSITLVNGLTWKANIDKAYNANNDSTTFSTSGNMDSSQFGVQTPRGRQSVTGASNTVANFWDMVVVDRTGTDHHGFIAYYNETTASLILRYKTDLYTADPLLPGNAWTTGITVDTSAGKFVKMVADPNGNLHLAYQDNNGYLKYAYVTYTRTNNADPTPDTLSGFTVKKVDVDQLVNAGANNSITVRDFGTNDFRPVITTYSSAFAGTTVSLRMSYPLLNPSNISFEGGVDSNGLFNQKWEVIVVPTATAPVDYLTFSEVTGAAAGTGKAYIGYKGSYLEEARFEEATARYLLKPSE